MIDAEQHEGVLNRVLHLARHRDLLSTDAIRHQMHDIATAATEKELRSFLYAVNLVSERGDW